MCKYVKSGCCKLPLVCVQKPTLERIGNKLLQTLIRQAKYPVYTHVFSKDACRACVLTLKVQLVHIDYFILWDNVKTLSHILSSIYVYITKHIKMRT